MPSDPAEVLSRLPVLLPQTDISRPVSTPEYYHACVGTSPHTLEGPRDVVLVLEGDSTLTAADWQRALDQVTAVNPGTRLRWTGQRSASRWESDGQPPRLRFIPHIAWDARSQVGADFITATPLSLHDGPTVELIVAGRGGTSTFVILRTLHTIMDGSGALHFLYELFRALRGEPLWGSNSAFSDVDLMLAVGEKHSTSRHLKTAWLTGEPAGDEVGDEWRRIPLGHPPKKLLARVAVAMAQFTHQHTDLPALIAIPVDLRRHARGLLSTTNFSNMLFVPLYPGDGVEHFHERLQTMLAGRMETVYPRILDLARWLPLTWFDRLVSRSPKNYRTRKAMETAVISNLGRCDMAAMSAPGFALASMFAIPLRGSAFSVLICIGDQLEFILNLPRVLSSNGRFDTFVEHLKQHLAEG